MLLKKWIKIYFITTLVVISAIGGFNYIVDPFHQYRVKTFYPIAYSSNLQRYINPGFAKHYDYNSVILGSSMCENFIISNVKNILGFKKPIKLCISGTSPYEESLTLRLALKYKEVKNVLFGLDTFLFWGDIKRTRHEQGTFPFYFYDDNFFNDYQYLISFDTFIKSMKILTTPSNKNDIIYNYDRMYQTQHKIPISCFSESYILKQWVKRQKSHVFHQLNNNFNNSKKNFDKNFLSIIKKYPKVNFIIYFPPYSILTYKLEQEIGVFKDNLELKRHIVNTTKSLSNVKIYDFQIAKNITFDLSNYYDLNHHHQKIHKWILEQIKKDNFKVTTKNINSFINILMKQVNNYKIKEAK